MEFALHLMQVFQVLYRRIFPLVPAGVGRYYNFYGGENGVFSARRSGRFFLRGIRANVLLLGAQSELRW